MDARETARRFLDEQIDLLRRGEVDTLVREHYHEDAVLLNQQTAVRGHQALRAFFRQYLETLGELTLDSVDLMRVAEDAFLVEATVTSSLGQARVYDAFVLREGRITHHFAGVIG